MGTYQKPLIDNLGHPKLSYYVNRMVFQRTWAGSKNVDVVYGPEDRIIPVINHLGNPQKVKLVVRLKRLDGRVLEEKEIENIELSGGHCIKELDPFRFKNVQPGTYVLNYEIQK